MIRVALVDDHAIVRDGIKQMMALTEDIVIAGEAANGAEAMRLLEDCACELLVLDMTMPGVSGVDLVECLRQRFPAIPILILSMHNDGQTIARAVRAGASGYVAKGSKSAVLMEAIRVVARGERYLDPAISGFVFDLGKDQADAPGDILSKRELEILRKIAAGDSLGKIADQFHLSPKTVSTHKMRIMQKLDIANNADLIRYAEKHGIRD